MYISIAGKKRALATAHQEKVANKKIKKGKEKEKRKKKKKEGSKDDDEEMSSSISIPGKD